MVRIRSVTLASGEGDAALLRATLSYNRPCFAEQWVVGITGDLAVATAQECGALTLSYPDRAEAERVVASGLVGPGRCWTALLAPGACWPREAPGRLAAWTGHPEVGLLYRPGLRLLRDRGDLRLLREKGVPPEDYWLHLQRRGGGPGDWSECMLFHSSDAALFGEGPPGLGQLHHRWHPNRRGFLPFDALLIGA